MAQLLEWISCSFTHPRSSGGADCLALPFHPLGVQLARDSFSCASKRRRARCARMAAAFGVIRSATATSACDKPSHAIRRRISRSSLRNRANASRAESRRSDGLVLSPRAKNLSFSVRRTRRAEPRRWLASTRRAMPYSHGRCCGSSRGRSAQRRQTTVKLSATTSSASGSWSVRRRAYAKSASKCASKRAAKAALFPIGPSAGTAH